MKGHGVAKSGETECTRINLKNIGPTLFQVYANLYMYENVICNVWRLSFLDM